MINRGNKNNELQRNSKKIRENSLIANKNGKTSNTEIEYSFKTMYERFNQNNENLTIMHINIRSLSKYFLQIKEVLANYNLSVLILTEISINKEQENLFKVEGYK